MPIITSLRPSRKQKTTLLLYIDNAFFCRLSIDLVIKHHLKLGQVIDQKLQKLLLNQSRYQYHLSRAINYLSFRPRSQHELKIYLLKNNVSPKHIVKILDRLIELRLQDDSAFADWLLKSRARQGKSLLFIKRELLQKGLSPELVTQKIQTASPPLPKITKILAVHKKYLKKDPPRALLFTKRYFASIGFTKNELDQIAKLIENQDSSDQLES